MLDWLRFFLLGPAVGFTAYVVLQVVGLWKLSGALRILALLPFPIMLWVVRDTIQAHQAGSNLWPIGLIFGGSIAAGFLALLLLYAKHRSR